MLTNFYNTKSLYSRSDQIGQPYIPKRLSDQLSIDIRDLKGHLKLPVSCDSFDSELRLIICAVQEFAESYTGRTFINKQYETYRDYFSCRIVLKRSPFRFLDSFQYLKDGEFLDIDPETFYVFQDPYYNKLIQEVSTEWPSDLDDRLQAIKIVFTAGYGALAQDIPCDLRIALLNHAAKLYVDRGDCGVCTCSNSDVLKALPPSSKLLYNSYRIKQLTPLNSCC